LSVEAGAIEAVDVAATDDDEERMIELVEEGMTDEVGVVESDVVVEDAAVPQKIKQKPMVVNSIMSVLCSRCRKECRAHRVQNESMWIRI
jgi:hypothetical protein